MSNFCYLFFIGLLQLAVVVMGSSVGPVGLTAQDYMLCGGISTALTDLLLFPVDTIKVTQQSSKELLKFSSALSQVIKTGGLPSLYKGALGYGLMDGLGGALFFSVYEKVKRDLADRFHLSGYTLSMSLYGAAGAAFVASSVFVVPAELLKARMQTQGFRSLGHCIKDAVAKERGGMMGLYTGYTATLFRDIPYFAFQLGFYDNIKDYLNRKLQEQQQRSLPSGSLQSGRKLSSSSSSSSGSPLSSLRMPQFNMPSLRLSPPAIDLISSLCSGLLTGYLTNPMDVVTARLMTQKADVAKNLLPGFRTSVGAGSAAYRGIFDCATRMIREEGIQSLSIGVKTRVSWIAPFVVISLGLNNYCKAQLLSWKQAQHQKSKITSTSTVAPVVKRSVSRSVRSTAAYRSTDAGNGRRRRGGRVGGGGGGGGSENVDRQETGPTLSTPLHQHENNQFHRRLSSMFNTPKKDSRGFTMPLFFARRP